MLLRLLFPAVCPICKEVVSENQYQSNGFCEKCLRKLSKYSKYISGVNNNYPSCDNLYCCFKYFGDIKNLIIAYKFNGHSYMHKSFANFMHSFLSENHAYDSIDLITYIPITSKRFAKRGYNQAKLIAKELYYLNNKRIPLINMFERNKNRDIKTSSQGFEKRKQEKFIFTGNKIFNKNILLIDDILTTGATIEECSFLLKKHGAQNVTVAVIASGRRDF